MEILTNYLTDIPHPVFIIHYKSREIIFANRSVKKILQTDLTGVHFDDVVHQLRLPVTGKRFAHFKNDFFKIKQSDLSQQASDHQLIELFPRTDIPNSDDLQKWKNMIALMLHRFRSPLTGMSGYLELLEGENEDHIIERRINFIQKGIDHLNDMMDELEVLYNVSDDPNSLELDQVYIEKVVHEVVIWFRQEQRNRLKVHENVKLTKILSNSNSLKELLKLILLNSLEHSDDTAIDVEIIEEEGTFIIIRNSGGPIPAELEERIFEPFMTTKAENFGIGLTKAVLYARQLGGSVFLEQEKDDVYFMLYLPIGREK